MNIKAIESNCPGEFESRIKNALREGFRIESSGAHPTNEPRAPLRWWAILIK